MLLLARLLFGIPHATPDGPYVEFGVYLVGFKVWSDAWMAIVGCKALLSSLIVSIVKPQLIH